LAVVASACSTNRPSGPSLVGPTDGGIDDSGADDSGADDAGGRGGPIDASIDAPPDAPADAPIDASPEITDLAVICGGTAPVTFDDWEDCYQKRKCEWEVGCVPLDHFRDVQDCVASADAVGGGQLAAERRDRKRAVDDGRTSINVEAFTQCLIRTSATRCNTALFDPACLTRFSGTIADNEDCLADVDCASPDAVCSSSCHDACCVGTCQRKFREGEDCQLFESCEPGLRCTGIKCVSGDIGTSCAKGSVNQCDFGTFCDSKTLRCTPTLAPGAACTSLLQCGGDTMCVGLSITVSDPGHCVRISKAGDPCDDFCDGNLYCDKTSGICRDLPELGQSCSLFTPCAGANTICDKGLCVLRSDVGVSCAGQTCLPGLFCTSELGDPAPSCAARRAVGEPCAAPTHCESYLCSGSANQLGVCLAWSDTCR